MITSAWQQKCQKIAAVPEGLKLFCHSYYLFWHLEVCISTSLHQKHTHTHQTTNGPLVSAEWSGGSWGIAPGHCREQCPSPPFSTKKITATASRLVAIIFYEKNREELKIITVHRGHGTDMELDMLLKSA